MRVHIKKCWTFVMGMITKTRIVRKFGIKVPNENRNQQLDQGPIQNFEIAKNIF